MSALNPKQQRFVDEYLIDLNATQAAIRAGYSEKTARAQGCRLLTNADIEAQIAKAQTQRAERTQITADAVVAELAKLGFANMQDYMRGGPDGLPYLDFTQLTREQAAALQEVTVDTIRGGKRQKEPTEGDEEPSSDETVTRVKFKLADKRAALVDLGRHLGMFVEKHEHSGPNGSPIESNTRLNLSGMTVEQLRALASIPVQPE